MTAIALPFASVFSFVGGLVGGLASGGASLLASVALRVAGSWVLDGAKAALTTVADLISRATAPQLTSAWFSIEYWRVAGIAAMLTVPFLFAAAIQALIRSDLALLLRAAFGYLPLAMIGVSLTAPVVMLLLAATDQMCSLVSGPGAGGGAGFLVAAARVFSGTSFVAGSAFLAIVLALVTIAAAIALAIEMLIRDAAVYVVVLMLPLAFAALVWPARRVWTTRMLELLLALILSKFVIVAVLSLAGSALGHVATGGVSLMLPAMTLVLLSAFAPWALLRLLPFTEIGAAAAGVLSGESRRHAAYLPEKAIEYATHGLDYAAALPAMLRRDSTSETGDLGSLDERSAAPGRDADAGSAISPAGALAGGTGALAGGTRPLAGGTGALATSSGGGDATTDAWGRPVNPPSTDAWGRPVYPRSVGSGGARASSDGAPAAAESGAPPASLPDPDDPWADDPRPDCIEPPPAEIEQFRESARNQEFWREEFWMPPERGKDRGQHPGEDPA